MIQRTESGSVLKVVSLDPGKTVGYASGVIADGKLEAVSGQAVWKEYELYLQLKLLNPDIIVYEEFHYRRNLDRAELFPRNLIGVINLYGQERAHFASKGDDKPVEVYTQTPAQGKSGQFSDDKLKAANMYKVANPHANDAMRHLLYWFVFGGGYKYNVHGYQSIA